MRCETGLFKRTFDEITFIADVSIHYTEVIKSTMASQITSLTSVYSIVYSGVDQRKHQRPATLAFVRGIHRWPVNSPHKRPVTRKMFPFDDAIMTKQHDRWKVGEQEPFLGQLYHYLSCCNMIKGKAHMEIGLITLKWYLKCNLCKDKSLEQMCMPSAIFPDNLNNHIS